MGHITIETDEELEGYLALSDKLADVLEIAARMSSDTTSIEGQLSQVEDSITNAYCIVRKRLGEELLDRLVYGGAE